MSWRRGALIVSGREPDAGTTGGREGTLAVSLLSVGVALVLAAPELPTLALGSYTLRMIVVLAGGAAGLPLLVVLARNRDWAGVLALTLAAWVLIGAAFSGAFRLAMVGTVGRELTGLIVIAGLGIWAAGRLAPDTTRRSLPLVLLAVLAVQAVVGLVQIAGQIETGWLAAHGTQADGLTANPVYFGALMAAGAGLAATRTAARWWAPALGVSGFAFAANLSGSRVALVSGFVAVVAAAWLDPAVARRLRMSLPVTYGLGLLASLLFLRAVSTSDGAIARVAGGDSGGRREAWRYGLEAVAGKPVFGWGFGRFRAATQEHYSADFVRTAAFDDVRQAWFDAHNVIVSVAVAIGVVGLLLAACFGVLACRQLDRQWVPVLLGILLTWLMQPIALATFPIVMFVLGVAASPWVGRDRQPDHFRAPATQIAFAVGLLAGAWILLGDLRLDRAIEHDDLDALASAAAMFPGDSVVADLVAQGYALQARFEPVRIADSLDWSRRAVDREPDRPLYRRMYGERLLLSGRIVEARASLEAAIELQPWHLQSWQALRILGELQGDDELVRLADARLCALAENCV